MIFYGSLQAAVDHPSPTLARKLQSIRYENGLGQRSFEHRSRVAAAVADPQPVGAKLSRPKPVALETTAFPRRAENFIFLLGAVIVTLAITHRNELDALVRQTASRALAHVQTKTATTETLRQNTVNYEKEVDEASK